MGGIACLLLALCVLVSFFNEDGWLIALLPMVLKGLFGLGYYVTVPALCIAAVILLTHRGRPVALRTVSALLLPWLFGTLCHLLFCRVPFETTEGMIPKLWTCGRELAGGGLFSGATALGFMAVLGKSASVVVMLVLLVVLIMVAFELTISKLVQMWRERELLEYSEDDYGDEEDLFDSIREASAERKKKAAEAKAKLAQIDIPLDPEPVPAGKNGSFFKPRGKDRLTPADLLTGEKPAAAEPVSEPVPVPEKAAEDVVPSVIDIPFEPEPIAPMPIAPEPVDEEPAVVEEKPKSRKNAAAELEQKSVATQTRWAAA